MLTPHKYQEEAISHLLDLVPRNLAGIDGSDCGVGKTLVAVEVMKRLNLPTLVVCPKAVRPGWERTAAMQGTDVSTMNYEMVRTGRTPFGEWHNRDLYHSTDWFKWNPAIKMLIFDEAHRCKGYGTMHAQMLKAARRQKIKTLALSATLADSPMEMDALGYLLRMHDSDDMETIRNPQPNHFLNWARDFGVSGNPPAFFGGTQEMARLNSVLYPGRGVRVKIADLGDAFPETQITSELYDIESPERMTRLYALMAEAVEVLKGRTDRYNMSDPMSRLMAARQEAELLKVPVFVDLAKDAVAQGMSVAIFVNFRLTLEEVCSRLNTTCRIDGSQVGDKGAREREDNRCLFQSDVCRVIVCTGDAGGVGLDLHDVTGKHPRLSLISPGYNAKVVRQIMGRVRRSGARSKSVQRFIFATGVEEEVHASVSRKLDNLDALNDGDLVPANLRFSAVS